MSGLAAVCNCGTIWTYLWFFIEIYWRQKETFHQNCCITYYIYIMQVRKCGLSWFLVVFHTMTYWKFGSVFFFFKTWVGPSFIRMHRARVAQAYIWYLPISEGAPYILPIFWENHSTKIWEFPSLFNHSPYLKKKISLFVISNVSHVWTQAFFLFLTEFRKSLWKLFDKQDINQILKRNNNEKRQEKIMIMI